MEPRMNVTHALSTELSTADAALAVRVPATIAHRLADAIRVEAVERGGFIVLKYRDSDRYVTPAGYTLRSIEAAQIRYEARRDRRDAIQRNTAFQSGVPHEQFDEDNVQDFGA